ncbi:hypothetical protein QR665_15885, partial [Acinetobacter gerneri]|uniref:hypothetical protein n=1 Tax=Acinetobacter gerneri TaxID=202952 RepID=UPI002935C178
VLIIQHCTRHSEGKIGFGDLILLSRYFFRQQMSTDPILYCFIPTSSSVDRGIAIGITIGMGAGGNGIYKNFVDQKIKKIMSLQPNNLEQELREQGGTDFYSPLGLLIVVIVLYWIGHNFA